MTNVNSKVALWFVGVSIVLLIWNLLGLMTFFQHMTMSPKAIAELPINEQELYAKFPSWTKIAFAIAVFGGVLGSIAILLKKKIAKPIFIISFIGIVLQMFHSIVIARMTDVYGPGAIVMPLLVLLIGVLCIWMSNKGIAKNWLK